MKQRWLLIAAAASFLGSVPAHAQRMAADVLPPYEVATIVRSMGLTPIDRPYWRNGRYVLTATDRSGREMRVVVDAMSGQVIRVRPMDVGYYDGPRGYGVRPDPYDPRYAAPPPPPRSIPNPGYGAQPGYGSQPGYPQQQPRYEDDDDEYDGRTGSIAPRQSQPPQNVTAPKVNTSPLSRSASIAPAKSPDVTPLPRPKPEMKATASRSAEPPPAPQGEIRKIEIKKPESAPDVKASEAKAPDAPTPSEAKAPDAKPSETKTPEASAPEVKKDAPKTGTIETPVTPLL